MSEKPQTLEEAQRRIDDLEEQVKYLRLAGGNLAEIAFPITIELNEPVQHGDKSISKLQIRKPLMGDLMGIPWNEMTLRFDTLLDVAAVLTGVSRVALEKVPASEGHLLTEIARRFLQRCR